MFIKLLLAISLIINFQGQFQYNLKIQIYELCKNPIVFFFFFSIHSKFFSLAGLIITNFQEKFLLSFYHYHTIHCKNIFTTRKKKKKTFFFERMLADNYWDCPTLDYSSISTNDSYETQSQCGKINHRFSFTFRSHDSKIFY